MISITRAKSILIYLLLLQVDFTSADLDTRSATGQCSARQATGSTNFCSCTGYCRDGSALGDPGQCQNWWNSCADAGTPSCSSTQVFQNFQKQTVDQGTCGNGGASCYWAQYTYTWECCNCPPGYWSWGQNCNGPSVYCLKCTESDESLKLNPNTQNYICNGPKFQQKACDMINSHTQLLDTFSTATTILGGLCPTQGIFSAITKGIGLAINGFQLAKNEASGQPTFPQQLSVLTAVESLLLGTLIAVAAPVEVTAGSVAAGVLFAYGVTCTVLGAAGTMLTAAKAYGGFDKTCPKATSKRAALLDGPVSTAIATPASTSHYIGFGRTGPPNPCADLFTYLPTVFDTAASMKSACDGIQPYYIGDTLDAGVANTSVLLHNYCGQMRASRNDTILIEYSNLLSALYDAIPYCYLTANGTATTLDAASRNTTSSSSGSASISTSSRSTTSTRSTIISSSSSTTKSTSSIGITSQSSQTGSSTSTITSSLTTKTSSSTSTPVTSTRSTTSTTSKTTTLSSNTGTTSRSSTSSSTSSKVTSSSSTAKPTSTTSKSSSPTSQTTRPSTSTTKTTTTMRSSSTTLSAGIKSPSTTTTK